MEDTVLVRKTNTNGEVTHWTSAKQKKEQMNERTNEQTKDTDTRWKTTSALCVAAKNKIVNYEWYS